VLTGAVNPSGRLPITWGTPTTVRYDEGDWLNQSALFHEAAWRVINCGPERQRRLHAPTLHLLAHGYETLLKSAYLSAGEPVPKTHDLLSLWNSQACREIRSVARDAALECRDHAASCGWLEGDLPEDPFADFEAHLGSLSALHSNATNYRLRYPDGTNPSVPLPLQLHCVLGRLIDGCSTNWAVKLDSPTRVRVTPF
jgi:hypothetical protein